MQRTLQAAEIAGIRTLAVHAKDEDVRRFYEHFDFVPPYRSHAPLRPAQRCAPDMRRDLISKVMREMGRKGEELREDVRQHKF